jgi:ribonuclease VapC
VILDTSAVVAIMLREPGHERLVERLANAEVTGIGAPTRSGPHGEAPSVVPPVAWPIPARGASRRDPLRRRAVEAYGRFGRGHHPAGLNFGDCLTYATTRLAGQPLLCAEGDFAKTDLTLA